MNHTKAAQSAGRACFSVGDKVEVLSSEDGFSDAWATATLASQSKGDWLVEYSKFVDADGKLLREKVKGAHFPVPGERGTLVCG